MRLGSPVATVALGVGALAGPAVATVAPPGRLPDRHSWRRLGALGSRMAQVAAV